MTKNFEKFDPSSESIEEFLSRFQLQNYKEIKNDSDQEKASVLASSLPSRIVNQLSNRVKPRNILDIKYEDLMKVLKDSFSVKKSTISATCTFKSRTRQEEETFEEFATAITELADKCNFPACCIDRMLRDQYIFGLNSRLAQRLCLEGEGKSFQQIVEASKAMYQAEKDFSYKPVEYTPSFKNQQQTYKVTNQQRSDFPKHKNAYNQEKIFSQDRDSSRRCYCCNRLGHLKFDCKFKAAKCFNCGRMGHIRSACRSIRQPRPVHSRRIHTFKTDNGARDNYRDETEEGTVADVLQVNRIRRQQVPASKKTDKHSEWQKPRKRAKRGDMAGNTKNSKHSNEIITSNRFRLLNNEVTLDNSDVWPTPLQSNRNWKKWCHYKKN